MTILPSPALTEQMPSRICKPPSEPGVQLCSSPFANVPRNSLREPTPGAPFVGVWNTIESPAPMKKFVFRPYGSTYSKPEFNSAVLISRGEPVNVSLASTGSVRFQCVRSNIGVVVEMRTILDTEGTPLLLISQSM